MSSDTIRVPIKGKHRDELNRTLGILSAREALNHADPVARKLPGWNYAVALLDAMSAEARQRTTSLGYKAAARHGVDLNAYELHQSTADFVEWKRMDLIDLADEDTTHDDR